MQGWRTQVLVLAFLLSSSFTIDIHNAVNITVYHVTPDTYGTTPVNQNTANFRGFMSFSILGTFSLAVCTQNSTANWCKNPEVFSAPEHLVITALVLEVDKRFGTYGKCNICLNGHDPFDERRQCAAGQYICNCEPDLRSLFPTAVRRVGLDPPMIECDSAVGHADLATQGWVNCTKGSSEDDCWFSNMDKKIGGDWYSTFDKGQCKHPMDIQCTWRVVQVLRRIRKDCANRIIYGSVEASNPDCFSQCGARNVTSLCWARCFMSTVIGPNGGHTYDISGLPLPRLLQIWSQPFQDPENGGCPHLPVKHGSDPSVLLVRDAA